MSDKIEGCLALLALIIIKGLLICWLISMLWNYVVPTIFNLPEISPKQAFVLYILIKLLFGFGTINLNTKTKN